MVEPRKLSYMLLTMKKMELPLTEMALISLVVENPGITAPQMLQREELSMSRQAMSAFLSILVNKGLIVSLPDPSHGKRKVLMATKEGKRLYTLVTGLEVA